MLRSFPQIIKILASLKNERSAIPRLSSLHGKWPQELNRVLSRFTRHPPSLLHVSVLPPEPLCSNEFVTSGFN